MRLGWVWVGRRSGLGMGRWGVGLGWVWVVGASVWVGSGSLGRRSGFVGGRVWVWSGGVFQREGAPPGPIWYFGTI